ncbi:MAG: BspA family leucine-rich repeat surface protein, partial [Cyclobacteriaceae bacterium]|nr:BspA family leucine-rich repeat surface protein [Cyclobacteriaceae bacterium]
MIGGEEKTFTKRTRDGVRVLDINSNGNDPRIALTCTSGIFNMRNLFNSGLNREPEFNQSLVHWDVSNVTNMDGMFRTVSSFNQPLNTWDVSNVTSMIGMFDGATSFNQPLDDWDVSSVISMNSMFAGATSFNQSLGSWDVSSVNSMVSMFELTVLSSSNYTETLQGWSQLSSLQSNVTLGAQGLSYCDDSSRDILVNDFSWNIQGDVIGSDCVQNITFASIEPKTFGDAPFELTATASSGLDVSYSIGDETVATIAGNVVTIVGAGTTEITAFQLGNNNFEAAEPVTRTLTVEKASQTITFAELSSKTFGDASFELTATSSSGLDVTYSSSDETVATIVDNVITIVGGGTTEITASQEGNNIFAAAEPVTRVLTVEKLSQTITFAELSSKTFGDASFELTATSSSDLNVSYSSSDETVATIEGNVVTIVGAGTTEITASQEGNDNFAAAEPVTRVLTVEKLS